MGANACASHSEIYGTRSGKLRCDFKGLIFKEYCELVWRIFTHQLSINVTISMASVFNDNFPIVLNIGVHCVSKNVNEIGSTKNYLLIRIKLGAVPVGSEFERMITDYRCIRWKCTSILLIWVLVFAFVFFWQMVLKFSCVGIYFGSVLISKM